MGQIEVQVETEISAAPADVAGVMFDPQRESEWMKAVTGVELLDPELRPGARVRRHGAFMGRELSWVTEVEAVHFPHVLTLRIIEGPFVGTVRYDIQRSANGSRVRIRNVGELTGLGFLPASLVTGPMRTALDADLGRLKTIVESSAPPGAAG